MKATVPLFRELAHGDDAIVPMLLSVPVSSLNRKVAQNIPHDGKPPCYSSEPTSEEATTKEVS